MGWTYTHKEKETSVKEFFEKEFNQTEPYGKVLDCAVRNRVAYIAYVRAEQVKGEVKGVQTAKVYAIVCLLNYSRKDHCNFGYKDMDEAMGPYSYDCPKRILNLLTPTDHPEALKWRQTCLDNLTKPKPKFGDVVEFAEPIDYGSYGKLKKFTFEKGSIFRHSDFATRFRISRWKEREYTVNKVKYYVIQSETEKDSETGEPLYWNNQFGWTTKKKATKIPENQAGNVRLLGKWALQELT